MVKKSKGKEGNKMESTEPESKPSNPNPNSSNANPKEKKKEKVKEKNQEKGKEGGFLLGSPKFVEIGGGRWRCVETGHEMPEREKKSYGKCKACRVALIDAAVAKKKPPLNAFDPHPTSKSQLICKLTGDVVNKTEEQIWKHINGKRFQNKLEQMELQKMDSEEPVEKEKKQSKKSKKSKKPTESTETAPKKEENKKQIERDCNNGDVDGDVEEETDFWVPPVGDRWDFDDGRVRWGSSSDVDDDAENGSLSDDGNDKEDTDSGELSKQTKRLSIAVGPSSFASRKKKMKISESDEKDG